MIRLIVIPFILLISSCTFWGLTSNKIVSQIDIAVNEDFTRMVYSDGYCYLASGLNGLRIINVKDPTNPFEIGGYRSIDLTEKFYDVAVQGNYAYLVSNVAFYILNISNKDSIGLPVSLPIIDGRNIIVEVNYAYIAGDSLYVIDITNPAIPTNPGSILINSTSSIGIKGNYIFTSQGEIIDISNENSPVLIPNTTTFGTADISISGNYIYGIKLNGSDINHELVITDIGNPINTKTLTKLSLASSDLDDFNIGYASIDSADGFVYVALIGLGVNLIDSSDPGDPKIIDLILKSQDNVYRVVSNEQFVYILSERSLYIIASN